MSAPLYRAFDTLSFAQDLTAGRFRMSRLEKYRQIEEEDRDDTDDKARTDIEEGRGHYIDGAGITERFERGDPIYILCAAQSCVDLDFLKTKMGPYVVRIDDPDQLAADVSGYLKEKGFRVFGSVSWRSVVYSKGDVLNLQLDPAQRAELSVTQKPSAYRDQCEERLVAVLNVSGQNPHGLHLAIDLGRPLPYVTLIADEA